MANEKDTSKTINNMMDKSSEDNKNPQPSPQPNKPIILNENDSIEVNNLITLTDADITPELLEQLENKALEEQTKLEEAEAKPLPKIEQVDLDIPQGIPAENGAVNITGDILERPKQEETLDPLEEAKLNAVYKKYVIYIDNENEKFIDSLSLNDRKKLINDVLHEQNILTEEQRAERRKRETVIKIIISIITFIVTVPLIYIIFNVSMEATIQNYRHSKSNFEVLYKETGKIKLNK